MENLKIDNYNRNKVNVIDIAVIMSISCIVSLVLCFFIYTRFIDPSHSILDYDEYGVIGLNIWKGLGFTIFPQAGPTVYRGPLYPGLIALLLFLSNGAYPEAIWVGQIILNGLTCIIVYLISIKSWDRKTALLGSVGCAFYPVILYYVPRICNEILLAFLLTWLIYLSMIFVEKATILKGVCIGFILGGLCLSKATFLPLIIALPLTFKIVAPKEKIISILFIPVIAICLLAPWTIRNYHVSGKLIPVHTGAGFNLEVGNIFAQKFWESPLSYGQIWYANLDSVHSLAKDIVSNEKLQEAKADDIYKAHAWSEIKCSPVLFIEKIIISGFMFWYIGETSTATIILIILRLPIILLACLAIANILKNRDIKFYPAFMVIGIYWMCHWLFAPPAKLSVPVMPIIVALAASNFGMDKNDVKLT